MNQLNFKPRKSLGQNFLIDKNIALKIIDSLKLVENDTVLEIGIGKGFLTNLLLQYPIHYVGVEIDKLLFDSLKIRNSNSLSIELLNANFLDISLEHFAIKKKSKLIIVGNIPFSLTSSILLKLLQSYPFLKKSELMLQKEVAERIIALPGNRTYGTLSVLCQTFAEIHSLFEVSPNCFRPRPKVISRVVEMTFKESVSIRENEVQSFFNFVKSIFNQKRKILLNSLQSVFQYPQVFEMKDFPLKKNQLKLRAEQLPPATFQELFCFMREFQT